MHTTALHDLNDGVLHRILDLVPYKERLSAAAASKRFHALTRGLGKERVLAAYVARKWMETRRTLQSMWGRFESAKHAQYRKSTRDDGGCPLPLIKNMQAPTAWTWPRFIAAITAAQPHIRHALNIGDWLLPESVADVWPISPTFCELTKMQLIDLIKKRYEFVSELFAKNEHEHDADEAFHNVFFFGEVTVSAIRQHGSRKLKYVSDQGDLVPLLGDFFTSEPVNLTHILHTLGTHELITVQMLRIIYVYTWVYELDDYYD